MKELEALENLNEWAIEGINKYSNLDLISKIKIDYNIIKQALRLTPKITAEEIVKELNEEYNVNDFRLTWNGTHDILSFYSAIAPCDINCNVLSENKTLSVGADWDEEPFPLNLAHKITSFFIQESESE